MTLGIFTVKKIRYFKNRYYTYGGFGSYLEHIRKYFHKVILFAHVLEKEPDEGYYEIDMKDLKIIHLLYPKNELYNLLQIPYNFFISYLNISKCDIAHVRIPDYTGIYGALICKIKNKPYFVQIIADWLIEAKKTEVSKKFGLGLFLKLDYYIYVLLEKIFIKNQLVFAQGISVYERYKNISNCHLVVSTSHTNKDLQFKKIINFKKNTLTFLAVGRLTGIKNQKLLLKLISRLKENNISCQLLIIGDGPMKEKLELNIRELNIKDNVKLIGQIDHDELFYFFDKADLFLMSSRSEGTPKVILEAFARGIPVIAPNVGGIPTMIGNNERGYLFEENDLDDFFSKVLLAIHDKDLEEKRKKAFEFAKDNTIETSTRHMMDLVKKYIIDK